MKNFSMVHDFLFPAGKLLQIEAKKGLSATNGESKHFTLLKHSNLLP
jgi:hypothetical protein